MGIWLLRRVCAGGAKAIGASAAATPVSDPTSAAAGRGDAGRAAVCDGEPAFALREGNVSLRGLPTVSRRGDSDASGSGSTPLVTASWPCPANAGEGESDKGPLSSTD